MPASLSEHVSSLSLHLFPNRRLPGTVRYAFSAAAVALALGARYAIYEVTGSFGASALYVAVVAICSWYLAPMPALALGVLGTVLRNLVMIPLGESLLPTALEIGIECAVLVSVVLALNSLKQWLFRAQTETERHEAHAAQFAAETTQRQQDRSQRLTELTLELRTLTGVIQLAADAIDRETSTGSSMNIIRNACDQLSAVVQNLRELERVQ